MFIAALFVITKKQKLRLVHHTKCRKVGNIQYKVYTDNVNLLCCNSKNMHEITLLSQGGGEGWNGTREGIYKHASCIHFYLKQKANMAKGQESGMVDTCVFMLFSYFSVCLKYFILKYCYFIKAYSKKDIFSEFYFSCQKNKSAVYSTYATQYMLYSSERCSKDAIINTE